MGFLSLRGVGHPPPTPPNSTYDQILLTNNISKRDVIREPKFFSRPNQFSIARMEFEEHLVSEEFLGEKSPQICTLADIFLSNGMLLE